MVKKFEDGEKEWEVIGLEPVERAVEKLKTHKAQCTNCRSPITEFFFPRANEKAHVVSTKLRKQPSNKTLHPGDKNVSAKLLKQKSTKFYKESAIFRYQAYDTEIRGSWIGREIINSIVHGGLMVSVTSLAVISSTSASGTDTATTVTVGLANVLLGLFVIFNNLLDLKNSYYQYERYEEILGRRKNFRMHATVILLSYLVFGLVPPLVYGFTFGDSVDKLLTVAVASFMCIILLAVAKAYTKGVYKIKTVLYNVIGGILAIGVGYAAGYLIKKLIDGLGLV